MFIDGDADGSGVVSQDVLAYFLIDDRPNRDGFAYLVGE